MSTSAAESISGTLYKSHLGLGVKCGAVRVQCTVGRSSVVVEFNLALAVKSMQAAWIGRLSKRKIPYG